MAGRFGKYGELKRPAALRKRRREKRHVQKQTVPQGGKTSCRTGGGTSKC